MKQSAKEKLLDVGMNAIRQGGFSAVSIKDLVTKAGVPKGSFHYYFESKESFGLELIDHYIRCVQSHAAPILKDKNRSAFERLRGFFQDYGQRMQSDGYKTGCLVGLMAMEVCDGSQQLREKTRSSLAMFHQFLEPFVVEAQKQGDIRNELPAAMLSNFIADSWQGALLRMKAEQSGEALKEFDQMLFEEFLPVK
jgi:TetR/AcrR family transcriptional repressor of nem operon